MGQPPALSDLAAFVRASDGTLRELGWDGDRWAWHNPGPPPGTLVAGNPVGHIRNEPPKGSLGTNRVFKGVYVIASNGSLYEYRWTQRGPGNWISLGNPGVGLAGTPGIAGSWQLMV